MGYFFLVNCPIFFLSAIRTATPQKGREKENCQPTGQFFIYLLVGPRGWAKRLSNEYFVGRLWHHDFFCRPILTTPFSMKFGAFSGYLSEDNIFPQLWGSIAIRWYPFFVKICQPTAQQHLCTKPHIFRPFFWVFFEGKNFKNFRLTPIFR